MKYGHDFAAMKDGAYNREVENQRYRDSSMEYLSNTGLDPTNQSNLQEASEAALLNLYGNMVNIAKQKIGDQNAKILKLDSNNRVKSTDPC